jgi:hypothetical protein
MRRLCIPVLVALSALVFAAPAASEEASTESIPAIIDDGGACTGAPETLPGIFDFTEACEQHDACYAGGADRRGCDLAFRQDLIAACTAQHPDVFDPRRYACFGFAELYFIGVTLFGGFFF